MSIQVKVVLVGNSGVGKTSIIETLTNFNKFVSNNLPTITCGRLELFHHGSNYYFAMFDSNSNKDNEVYKTLRMANDYPGTNVFGICYSIADRISYEDCYNYWYNELKQFDPSIPIILISTKSDLYSDSTFKNLITHKEAIEMSNKLNAFDYIETSSKDVYNLSEVFIRSGVHFTQLNNNNNKFKNKKTKCIIN